MPQLAKGGKWVFGWVIVGPAAELPIPPEAWDEYRFQVGDEVTFLPGSRRSGGFGLSHPRLMVERPRPLEARALARGHIEEGRWVVMPAAVGVQPGDRLLAGPWVLWPAVPSMRRHCGTPSLPVSAKGRIVSREREVEERLRHILGDHCRRYPRLQVVDFYKLLHQASMGSEHAVSDEDGVRAWLESELANMGAGPQEPLIDPISPSGEIVRVHLRPYLEAGHDPEQLLEAFLRTAREVRGSTERLRRDWAAAERMMLAGRLPFAPDDDMDGFMQRMERQGFPAMHHSRIYERSYRPAYRVVARTLLELEA